MEGLTLDEGSFKALYNNSVLLSRNEFGKGIPGGIRITFLTLVVFGTILGYSYMLIMESMVGGGNLVRVFMENAVIMTGVYIVLQIIACEWSGRRFLNKVTEN